MRWGGERESPKASSTHNPEAATGSAARARDGKVRGALDVREEPRTWLGTVPLGKTPMRRLPEGNVDQNPGGQRESPPGAWRLI